MNYKVNGSIQILPKTNTEIKYEAIDRAINVIKESGLKYIVCPFDTVIEGPFQAVQETMYRAMEAAMDISDEIIVITKWQINRKSDVFIENKIAKYRSNQ